MLNEISNRFNENELGYNYENWCILEKCAKSVKRHYKKINILVMALEIKRNGGFI